MQNIIISIIENFGYFGVMFLIAIENIFPPIPSELILLFGGFITTKMQVNLFMMIVFSTLGSLCGALSLYCIGRILNKDRLKNIIGGKIERFTGLKQEDIDKATSWFDKKGYKAVFYCRFIPILRSLISVPAGMNKMNVIKFSFYSVMGASIWNVILLILGNRVGENWQIITTIIDRYSIIILCILVFVMVLLVIKFYFKRIKKRQ